MKLRLSSEKWADQKGKCPSGVDGHLPLIFFWTAHYHFGMLNFRRFAKLVLKLVQVTWIKSKLEFGNLESRKLILREKVYSEIKGSIIWICKTIRVNRTYSNSIKPQVQVSWCLKIIKLIFWSTINILIGGQGGAMCVIWGYILDTRRDSQSCFLERYCI